MAENATESPPKHTSMTALRNEMRKNMIRAKFGTTPMEPGLVKRPFRYRNKRMAEKSLRQYRRGVARQVLYDAAHKRSGKPKRNWRATLSFMLMVTPNQGEVLHFRVIVGKGVSEKARQVLSGPDTHISEICRRNESFVQIENQISKNDQLMFTLSGSEIAVRNSLRDIIGVVGAITAVRISDPAFRGFMLDVWKEAVEEQPKTRLLRSGETGQTVVDDKTLTVKSSSSSSNTHSVYKPYELRMRADDIKVPKEWTKTSFEEYVAALVHGRIPNHLARPLYPKFPDHQQTVVSILVDLFHTRAARSAISLSATKMAIGFIGSTGRGFRRATRLIYNRVRSLRMPVDAELYSTLLVNSSKAKDLNNFNRVLRVMVRKGYPPQSRAWVAFLVMMPSPAIKRYIVKSLRAKNLDQNPMILRAIGREMATVDLEFELSSLLQTKSATPLATFNVHKFVARQNEKYGHGWLDTITLNKMLDILGKHALPEACKDLLGLVHSARPTLPDAGTLNTILSRANGFANQMQMLQMMLKRWPRTDPDDITYHILFRLAWNRRYPNMLRVVWRYAVLSHKTTSKMRYTLSKLLRQTGDLSNRSRFLKEWEDVIFGQTELAEMRASHPDGFHVRHMLPKYVTPARGMRPALTLRTKLKEAITMDVKIHQILKEGKIADKQSLSVDIPLVPKVRLQVDELHAFEDEPDVGTLRSKDWYDPSPYPTEPETKTRVGNRWVVSSGK